MSTNFTGSKHTAVWLWAPFAALVLYIATWPVIEMKCTKVTTSSAFGFLHGSYFHDTSLSVEFPAWAGTVYAPLHQLCRIYPKTNPLIDYWTWWSGVLKHEGWPMWSDLGGAPP
ncbi:hypothetical protein AYO49_05385 [Verrucomicrobiaceae bacterium SCGC AG-212-N21]|nr:hypothetical protein AYO49_05385 [Verrucomicrobiaceae bacterium SCGC AG-212-N21]